VAMSPVPVERVVGRIRRVVGPVGEASYRCRESLDRVNETLYGDEETWTTAGAAIQTAYAIL